MKKIGLLALAIVLALGALGVGYAAWTDTITINGTVNTGTLDIDAVYFSGSDIYKDLTPGTTYGDTVTYFWVKDAAGNLKWSSGTVPALSYKVASAEAHPTASVDDSVTITFTDAFPSDALVADVIIHCDGSVPAIVTADVNSTDPILNWLWDNEFITVKAQWVAITDPGGTGLFTNYQTCGEIVGPIQMHYCDYAKIWLYLDLPQADDPKLDGSPYTQDSFMNLSGLSFTGSFDAIQWNESPFAGTASSNPCNQ